MARNHRIWFRQDYTEPAPLTSDELQRISSCIVVPRIADRITASNWHAVWRDGQLVGYVTTRTAGQGFRTPDMEDWWTITDDWTRAEPPHARAILHLLDFVANREACDD